MPLNTGSVLPLLFSMALAVGCSTPTDRDAGATVKPSLTLATTTSTQDSGLLDVLIPLFTADTGIEVKTVAVGTGQALEIGRRGDSDVLLTHAPAAEQPFMSEGYGESRREVMYNDFVLVGPNEDPAHITGQTSIVDILRQIADAKAIFVSRGDESGTHMKEKAIWDKATITPQGDWYLSAGSGMAATLRLASDKRGYALADRSTFLSQQDKLDLAVVSEGDSLLRNVYSLIVVHPVKHPHVHHQEAQQFADFLATSKVQETIGRFGIDKYGQALFFPLNRPAP